MRYASARSRSGMIRRRRRTCRTSTSRPAATSRSAARWRNSTHASAPASRRSRITHRLRRVLDETQRPNSRARVLGLACARPNLRLPYPPRTRTLTRDRASRRPPPPLRKRDWHSPLTSANIRSTTVSIFRTAPPPTVGCFATSPSCARRHQTRQSESGGYA